MVNKGKRVEHRLSFGALAWYGCAECHARVSLPRVFLLLPCPVAFAFTVVLFSPFLRPSRVLFCASCWEEAPGKQKYPALAVDENSGSRLAMYLPVVDSTASSLLYCISVSESVDSSRFQSLLHGRSLLYLQRLLSNICSIFRHLFFSESDQRILRRKQLGFGNRRLAHGSTRRCSALNKHINLNSRAQTTL